MDKSEKVLFFLSLTALAAVVLYVYAPADKPTTEVETGDPVAEFSVGPMPNPKRPFMTYNMPWMMPRTVQNAMPLRSLPNGSQTQIAVENMSGSECGCNG